MAFAERPFASQTFADDVTIAVAATTQSASALPVRLPNNQVGPMALRRLWHTSPFQQSALAPVTNQEFATRVMLPNNLVGPMALRVMKNRQSYPFDTSLNNRRRRVICSSA